VRSGMGSPEREHCYLLALANAKSEMRSAIQCTDNYSTCYCHVEYNWNLDL
jgi:hypothetical protein